MKPRDNLTRKPLRCHYNKTGKSKLTFDTRFEAELYLLKIHLLEYNIYQCKYCNKYHVSHKHI